MVRKVAEVEPNGSTFATMTMKMSIRLQKKSAMASTMIAMAKSIMARIPATKCGTPTSMGMATVTTTIPWRRAMNRVAMS